MILIGHRGVGKSSLLQRLQFYTESRGIVVPMIDLDREIEKQQGTSITEIFKTKGEAFFRQLEHKNFERIIKTNEVFVIALGAGFQLQKLQKPNFSEVVWVRRKSDRFGRIFNDRPRLDANVDPIEEFQNASMTRNLDYESVTDWIYDLPEGLTSTSDIEDKIFFGEMTDIGGAITVLPFHQQRLNLLTKRYLKWGVDLIELRNDLLENSVIKNLLCTLPKERTLLSFRSAQSAITGVQFLESGLMTDWALELGAPPKDEIQMISIHHRKAHESLADGIGRLNSFSKSKAGQPKKLKLAVPIQNFAELKFGLEWFQEDPRHRNFLPRSVEGNWDWCRLWLKDRQYLNFWREGVGSGEDQPSLFEWLSTPSRCRSFGAVLGDPIVHSFSPVEHHSYFRARAMPYLRIRVPQEESSGAFELLKEMGLKAASVTSPLKQLFYRLSKDHTPESKRLGSTNTLTIEGHKVLDHNTDLEGFKAVIDTISELGIVVVWGGGGTLTMIQQLIPKAVLYSSSTGHSRQSAKNRGLEPDTLIWAASPRSKSPAKDWNPSLVIDLNYREDSEARSYAIECGARYISGFAMFKSQAQAQQQFWERTMGKDE